MIALIPSLLNRSSFSTGVLGKAHGEKARVFFGTSPFSVEWSHGAASEVAQFFQAVLQSGDQGRVPSPGVVRPNYSIEFHASRIPMPWKTQREQLSLSLVTSPPTPWGGANWRSGQFDVGDDVRRL
jgi:hypothetical protein